ncbi:hypothetical protein MPSEU_000121400 [Mayamaea pseudoterrestris]|nr:hypothetical protein MPSEU_000121400 [Mayamaea pseudoterrestris]
MAMSKTMLPSVLLLLLAALASLLWLKTYKIGTSLFTSFSPSSITTTYPSSSVFLKKFNAVDNARTLNIHMVPHTHDDVGWLKTVEQYYEAHCNDSIDTRGNVRGIITTTIQSLLENDARTFVFVEMKFFRMWWMEQSDAIKDSVRYLIANEQLSFANGGYSMHDEACAHYIGMVDQTSLGHDFLWQELGYVPTVGWQLDPFGHSATQANLLTARTGLDALYFGRIDYQDLELRQARRECEGLWDATSSSSRNGSDSSSTNSSETDDRFDPTIFWGLTGSYQGNYGPPDGFWYDVLTPDNVPLVGMDEPQRVERVTSFLRALQTQADQTLGNHVMVTLGSDFHYSEAHYNFANYDLLTSMIMMYQEWNVIDVASMFGPDYDQVNVFYSSPGYYTKQKHEQAKQRREHSSSANQDFKSTSSEASVDWSTKTDDFFPYSDGPHNFWTGYFSSRTAFKRFERVASGFLLAARQIEAKAVATTDGADASGIDAGNTSCLHALENALAVAQHHDAVSGTAKQHVADDYSKRLQAGLDEAAAFVAHKLKRVMLEHPALDIVDLEYCQLLNETICEVSENVTRTSDRPLIVVVYNPLAYKYASIVRLPIAAGTNYQVERLDDSKEFLPRVQVVQPMLDPRPNLVGGQKHVLHFNTGNLPAAGAVAFRVSKLNRTKSATIGSFESQSQLLATQRGLGDKGKETSIAISNEFLTATFNRSTGMLEHVDASRVALDLEQTTPEQSLLPLLPANGKANFIKTDVGTEVHVAFKVPWVHQVTRIFETQPFIEIEYTVGPIPIDDGRGKEIVTRWQSNIESDVTFYTDSNGREFQERRKNHRPSWNLTTYEPVAGNYYPVNTAIYIKDKTNAMFILTDRSQGGASLESGSMELMVQRRTLVDDGRGVDEPLNETTGGMTAYPPYGNASRVGDGAVIRGVHRIMVGQASNATRQARKIMDQVFAPPLVFVGSEATDKPVAFRQPSFSALNNALPPEVMLVTFARLASDERNRTSFRLRLAHQLEDGDADEPQSVTVDLTMLFTDYEVLEVSERTLSGNQDWDDYLERRLTWTKKQEMAAKRKTPPTKIDPTNIKLQPMDIRTFHVAVKLITDVE